MPLKTEGIIKIHFTEFAAQCVACFDKSKVLKQKAELCTLQSSALNVGAGDRT